MACRIQTFLLCSIKNIYNAFFNMCSLFFSYFSVCRWAYMDLVKRKGGRSRIQRHVKHHQSWSTICPCSTEGNSFSFFVHLWCAGFVLVDLFMYMDFVGDNARWHHCRCSAPFLRLSLLSTSLEYVIRCLLN